MCAYILANSRQCKAVCRDKEGEHLLQERKGKQETKVWQGGDTENLVGCQKDVSSWLLLMVSKTYAHIKTYELVHFEYTQVVRWRLYSINSINSKKKRFCKRVLMGYLILQKLCASVMTTATSILGLRWHIKIRSRTVAVSHSSAAGRRAGPSFDV